MNIRYFAETDMLTIELSNGVAIESEWVIKRFGEKLRT